ncbi:MAG: hypothetical protein HRT67_02810 [Flavobacteriaceae bacterium]|nr:hypothetical protein [Flavobacteriaceae bacterium]
MGLTIADNYYLKAKGAMSGWCSDWEEVCEALNYALSYDENHCASLCLLGEIYDKHLSMPEKAFECFDKVIAIDTYYKEVYVVYITALIQNNQLDRATKLIAFAINIQHIVKAEIYRLSSCIEEIKGNYNICIRSLKKAKKHCYNDDDFYFLIEEEKRIKKKKALDKPKKKKKKSKKKKKK